MRRSSVLVAVGFVASVACGGSVGTPTVQSPSPWPRTVLNSAEQSELARLELRPMELPAMSAGGVCPATGLSPIKPFKDPAQTIDVYGSGPVYGQGGPQIDSATNSYFDVVYYADPTVKGVILVRIQTLDLRYKGVFVGDYAAGPAAGTDTIAGKPVDLHGEVALPAARPGSNPALAAGWGSWPVRQGVDKRWTCVAVQVDSEAATEVIVVAA
jgi:hypothetical protein